MKLHWGNAIFIFFSIFLSLAAVFIIFSFRQNNDLVDDNYYEKGAAYSKQIEINKRSLAFSDSISFTNEGQTIKLKFCNNILENTSEIRVHFYRPSEKTGDYTIILAPITSEFYVEKSLLQRGRYIIKLSWEMNSMEYGLEKDLFVE